LTLCGGNEIVKVLKSPDSADKKGIALVEVVLTAKGEILIPREADIELRRRPVMA